MVLSRSSSLASVVISLLLSVIGNAQTPRPPAPSQTPPIKFEGRVVADDTGLALPNARVAPTFGTDGRLPAQTLTDGEGRFSFSFPRGNYTIAASKTGYARRDVPQPVAGQPFEIRLPRGSVMSGRVLEESGDPVAGASIALESSNGSRDSRPLATATTDDRGEYRLGGLSEGTFLPVVVTRGIPPAVRVGNMVYTSASPFEKTYYPNATTSDEARPVVLHSGEERSGIDFLLNAQQAMDQPLSVAGYVSQLRIDWDEPPPGTGVIRGRIISADGRGVSQAHVVLVPPPNPTDRLTLPRAFKTLNDGRFEFSNLAPGRYRVLASKNGFLPATSNGRADGTPNSPAIDLAAGETRDGVDIPLTRYGTMTGRVLDEYGFPVMGARVQALRVRYEGGRRKLVAVSIPDRTTDDRGEYRLYGLQPGQYIVSAFIGDVSSDDVPGYARTYFPGMASATDAQYVAVGAGQDVVGLDIALARVRTARISGRLIDALGQPGGGSLILIPTWRASTAPAEPIGARILPADGRFEFRNVPPDEYVIQSSRGRKNNWTEGEFAAMPIVVNGVDVNDLVLQTTTGSSVTGRITFNTLDRTKIPQLSAIEITAVPVDPDLSPSGAWANAHILADWQFEMAGLSGPRRLVVSRIPAGWTLEQIRAGGADVTDRPLALGRADQSANNVEIVLSDRVSQLTGSVTDDNHRPVHGAHVIVFAADRDRWFSGSRFLRDATTDEQGTYTVSGLPFGSYYVTATSQVFIEGPEAWQDPAFLTAQISRATSLTISEGQRVTRSIRLSSK
jgi:carboxypeptidase family protein